MKSEEGDRAREGLSSPHICCESQAGIINSVSTGLLGKKREVGRVDSPRASALSKVSGCFKATQEPRPDGIRSFDFIFLRVRSETLCLVNMGYQCTPRPGPHPPAALQPLV